MNAQSVCRWSTLPDRTPTHALVGEVDLVVLRVDDGVAVANSALHAIGCLGMRACHTNNCPVGIATQKPHLRERLLVDASARLLQNWLEATVHLMQVLAWACGHDHLSGFAARDLTTLDRDVAALTGVRYAGVV